MSNVIYGFNVVNPEEPDDTLVINSNDLITEKLELAREAYEKRLAEAQRKEREARAKEPLLDEEGNPILDEEGNPVLQGYDDFQEMQIEELPSVDTAAILQEAQDEADNIITNAHVEANDIIEKARTEAEAMRGMIESEAKKKGYEDGMQKGSAEIFELKTQNNQELERIKADYKNRMEAMEEELVDIISDVVSKVFKVQFSDSKDIILHVVENAISNIEGSKEFLIRVNEENFKMLQEKKQELQDKFGAGIQLDFVMDPVFDSSQCMIETDGGIFDCSLDTELTNLTKAIKSLSCI